MSYAFITYELLLFIMLTKGEIIWQQLEKVLLKEILEKLMYI